MCLQQDAISFFNSVGKSNFTWSILDWRMFSSLKIQFKGLKKKFNLY